MAAYGLKLFWRLNLIWAALCMVPAPALAYVGPGAGLSALGTVVALLGAVVLMIVGFFWYPIKRLWGKRKSGTKHTPDKEQPAPDDASP